MGLCTIPSPVQLLQEGPVCSCPPPLLPDQTCFPWARPHICFCFLGEVGSTREGTSALGPHRRLWGLLDPSCVLNCCGSQRTGAGSVYVTSPSLDFLICKIGMSVVAALQEE